MLENLNKFDNAKDPVVSKVGVVGTRVVLQEEHSNSVLHRRALVLYAIRNTVSATYGGRKRSQVAKSCHSDHLKFLQ